MHILRSDDPTLLLKFMQDPLSLLQLIEEPRAIILKRQDLSLIFALHHIFFLSEVTTQAEVDGLA